MKFLSFASLAFLVSLLFSIPVSAQVFQEVNGVKLYPATLVGVPSPTDIREDFLKGLPHFRTCHQTNLENGGKETGKISMEFFIGKNGKAYNPIVTGDMPKSVKDCLIVALIGLQFDPYTDGEDIKVTQPIAFKAISLTGSKEKK